VRFFQERFPFHAACGWKYVGENERDKLHDARRVEVRQVPALMPAAKPPLQFFKGRSPGPFTFGADQFEETEILGWSAAVRIGVGWFHGDVKRGLVALQPGSVRRFGQNTSFVLDGTRRSRRLRVNVSQRLGFAQPSDLFRRKRHKCRGPDSLADRAVHGASAFAQAKAYE